jgi:hypothetical protein
LMVNEFPGHRTLPPYMINTKLYRTLCTNKIL